MKSREKIIRRRARMKRFQVDEKRRRVTQIESMIAEFERIAADLDQEIKTEQDRSGIHDPAHFAYPTYAKAAMQRRENLRRSAADLKPQLDDAKAAVAEEFEKMKKAELLDERYQMRERADEAHEPLFSQAHGPTGNGRSPWTRQSRSASPNGWSGKPSNV
jgi:flagellar FliJ protein